MRRSPVVLIAWMLLLGCGAPERRGEPADEAARAAQFRAIDRAYLQVRREERSCRDLQAAADTAFTQRLHGPALDADELLIAFCPTARLAAVEQTQVVLARTEARSGGPAGRSVRLRLGLPLPPAHRLLWWGAFVDGMLGLNNLPLGKHRVEVEMHVWQRGPDRDDPASGQMVRAAGAIDVQIDGNTPVMLDVVLAGGAGTAGAGQMPLALNLIPSQQALPAGATTGLEMEGNRPTAPAELARTRIPFPDPPGTARPGGPAGQRGPGAVLRPERPGQPGRRRGLAPPPLPGQLRRGPAPLPHEAVRAQRRPRAVLHRLAANRRAGVAGQPGPLVGWREAREPDYFQTDLCPGVLLNRIQ